VRQVGKRVLNYNAMGGKQMIQPLDDSQSESERYIDPMVRAYMPGIDVSLLLENLKLTPEERILKHDKMLRLVLEARQAGKRLRGEIP
jgi:hypothetical protein